MPGADYTIMMVEDELDYARTWIEKAFEEYDIDLVHYEDWETAFSKLKAEPDRFDALILDAKGKITRDDASE
ncbi:MAG: hypothetical protein JXB49_17035, partial [Bacteroidales bacterium]|nr:hypothetical protein [Bacteroidales bacterium]